MYIQIYISDEFSKNFLPFFLYRNILHNILKDTNEIEFIYNIDNIVNNKDSLLILNIYCLTSIYNSIINILKNYNGKIIIINTEHYENLNVKNILNSINDITFNIFEYNIINYRYFKNNGYNVFFVPLIYNIYLETYFNLCIERKINWNEKDIDIFFCGSLNKRRENIILKLKEKNYNVLNIQGYSGEQENINICNYINRSKIVLNILSYDYNIIFDYYRNSFLLANKTLLISERQKDIDYEIEYSLKDIENNVILFDYDEIIENIEKYINMNEYEITCLINKQYEWFKKNDMHNILDKNIKEII
jgi:hypothetical protein